MELTTAAVAGLSTQIIRTFLLAILPMLVVLAVLGLAVNAAQTGLAWSMEPLSPRLSRINPLEGAKRIFSRRALFELGKSLVKVALVAAVTYRPSAGAVQAVVARHRLRRPDRWPRRWAAMLLLWAGGRPWCWWWWRPSTTCYQRYEYEQSLKMTRQEVKEELRQSEGDPLLRSRIRRRQRELAQTRMLQEVRPRRRGHHQPDPLAPWRYATTPRPWTRRCAAPRARTIWPCGSGRSPKSTT